MTAAERAWEQATGFPMPYGTAEEARAMVGHRTDVRFADSPVSEAMIRLFAAMVEDANASYWDPEFAARAWGGIVSPPAMVQVWLMPSWWRPDLHEPVSHLAGQVPLPGDSVINVSTDTELFRPMRAGDRLNMVEELVEVSEEKKTRIGRGHFVTTVATLRREDGVLVARHTNVLFRFTSGTAG